MRVILEEISVVDDRLKWKIKEKLQIYEYFVRKWQFP